MAVDRAPCQGSRAWHRVSLPGMEAGCGGASEGSPGPGSATWCETSGEPPTSLSPRGAHPSPGGGATLSLRAPRPGFLLVCVCGGGGPGGSGKLFWGLRDRTAWTSGVRGGGPHWPGPG